MVSQLLYCKKIVCNPLSTTTTTTIIKGKKWNGQNSQTSLSSAVILSSSANIKSTLQKRLSHSMDNYIQNWTENLWSAECDNDKSKYSRKQRCMNHTAWNTLIEKRCIKGNWKWKKSTTKWAQQCRCRDWRRIY